MSTSIPEPGSLSVCMITLNEEKRIRASLEAVQFADQIVVVDSGSDDRTRQIARELGAEVKTHPFNSYMEQKNHAMSFARCEWILVIDADEVVTEQLQKEILASIRIAEKMNTKARAERLKIHGYMIPRLTEYLGQQIRHGGWYPDYNVRLVRNGAGEFEGGSVHENLKVDGAVSVLKNHLLHHPYENISQHLLRIDRYSSLIARDRFMAGYRSGITWSVGKACSKFFLTYFYRRGFLDGPVGLIISVMASYYNFLKYIKIWELRKGYRKAESIFLDKVK